jgi:membrane-bound lytic murein transglycosylase B
MNKNIIQTVIFLGLIAFIACGVKPAFAQNDAGKSQIKFKIASFTRVEPVLTEVKIIPGQSEIQKRDEAARIAAQALTRQVTTRERTQEDSSYSLGQLRDLYAQAGSEYGVDPRLIEAVHQVETGKSTSCKINSSGATGPMQFLRSTFRHYSDGDICNVHDAVFAASKLLSASGASTGNIDSALFSYNHSQSYVNLVKQVMNSI